MNRTCQYNIGNIAWSCVEYSVNNAWNYNNDNGCINNNNKNNGIGVRPVLELSEEDYCHADSMPVTYEDIYCSYLECRKHKSRKPSTLLFEQGDVTGELLSLVRDINSMEYIQRPSIAFVITKPKWREVIAADFRDRIVQTFLIGRLLPYFEQYEHPDSYSCRVGKGGLRAALKFNEYVAEVSENYTRDCWVFSLDFQKFFPSIDTNWWIPRLQQFIENVYVGDDKDIIKYLVRVIYGASPQIGCVRKSPLWMWRELPAGASMFERNDGVGLAIGNVTSQALANFVTTEFLNLLSSLGVKFVCYTDDIKGVVADKERFLNSLPMLRDFAWNELRLRLHPKKFDIQHYSKGIRVGAFKFRFDRLLPNDRIAHNFLYKALRAACTESSDNTAEYREQVVSFINSYLGMLRHCQAFRLAKQGIDMLLSSGLGQLFYTDGKYTKISYRIGCSPIEIAILNNKYRKTFTENQLTF